jgi:hypothetical protein
MIRRVRLEDQVSKNPPLLRRETRNAHGV